MSSDTTIGAALRRGTECLADSSSSAELDARLLMEHVLRVCTAQILTSRSLPIDSQSIRRYETMIDRRRGGEPLAYIIGAKEFWGLEFEVSPAVLIPRPETELVVERAVEWCSEHRQEELRVVDLGTGSGCIVVALGVELKRRGIEADLTAVDVSTAALEVARRNAARHGVAVRFLQSSWFEGLSGETFSVVLSNPPYIADGEEVSPELHFEPHGALYAPKAGLADIERILGKLSDHLRRPGYCLIEVGGGKSGAVNELVQHATRSGNFEYRLIGDMESEEGFRVVEIDTPGTNRI